MPDAALPKSKFASSCPLGLRQGPRRAQDGSKWAQDGPKKLRRTATRPSKIIHGNLLGHLEAISGHLGLKTAFAIELANQPRNQTAPFKPKATTPPSNHSASVFEAICLEKCVKRKIDFPPCHMSCQPQPFQIQHLPQDALLDTRASPTWA